MTTPQAKSEPDIKRTLILNVDRDADIELKAGVSTPILGREKILETASRLLLADPEEADGNALFASVKMLDELSSSEGEEFAVAAICGAQGGGFKADRKMAKELELVLTASPSDDIVVVSDGYADEEILPILRSQARIVSVRHVVVRHSRSVEETYLILGRYLRMIWTESPYRIYFVGIPGVAVLLAGLLAVVGLNAAIVILSIFGAAMAVHGFGIDEYVTSLRKAPTVELLYAFTTTTAVLSTGTGTYLSYTSLNALFEWQECLGDSSLCAAYAPRIAGTFLQGFLLYFLAGIVIFFSGILLRNIVVGEGPILRYIMFSVTMMVLYFVGNEVAQVLVEPARGYETLFFFITLGVAVLFLTSAAAYVVLRRVE